MRLANTNSVVLHLFLILLIFGMSLLNLNSKAKYGMTSVKLIAIAKNEAAYIPEWIFHHLYFGFDSIEILINRTSDNSISILKKINEIYPEVTYRSIDWIDMTPPSHLIQYIAYAQALDEAKKSEKYSHVMFLDIDEFWVPTDFCSTIQSVVPSDVNFDTISFAWFNLVKEEQFALLKNPVYGLHSTTVKSLISLKSNVSKIQLHLPEFESNSASRHLMSDGSNFRHDPAQRQRLVKVEDPKSFPACIVHRMFRSEMEYLSLLQRGRPSDNFPFKKNRPGYLGETSNAVCLIWPEYLFQIYDEKKMAFMNIPSIDVSLKDAQDFVKAKADKTVELLLNFQPDKKDWSDLKRIFSGVKNNEVKTFIESLNETDSEVVSRPKQATKDKRFPNKIKTALTRLIK